MIHQDILRQQEEYRIKLDQRTQQKLQKLSKTQSIPNGLLADRSLLNGDEFIVKKENQNLKESNFKENLKREQRKWQFKKQTIIEKEMKYTEKIKTQKNE